MEEGVDLAYELYWANGGILYLPCLPHKRHHSRHLLQTMAQRLPALITRLIDQHNTEACGVHSARSFRFCKADFDGNLWVDGAHRYLAVKQHQLVRLSQDVPCPDVEGWAGWSYGAKYQGNGQWSSEGWLPTEFVEA